MYVRVVTVHVQPGKLDEVWRRLREAIPIVRAIPGFREARFLTDVHTDTVLGVTLWETEADARPPPVAGAESGRTLTDLLLQALVAQWEHPHAATDLAEA